MVRLAKHSLPKQSNKVKRSAKHKGSIKNIEKKLKKENKKNGMDIDDNSIATTDNLTNAEKEALRLESKKKNAHRTLYKKNITHMTDRRGPRAVSGKGFC